MRCRGAFIDSIDVALGGDVRTGTCSSTFMVTFGIVLLVADGGHLLITTTLYELLPSLRLAVAVFGWHISWGTFLFFLGQRVLGLRLSEGVLGAFANSADACALR